MTRTAAVDVQEVAYHRNGVGGEGFHVVRFTAREDDQVHHMVGIVFDGVGQCAVLDVHQTAAGNIAFGQGNSWRGDVYEAALRRAIEESQS